MSAEIIRLEGTDAYDLIFPEYLSMLSSVEQDTMYRSMVNSSRVWMGMDDDKVLALWGLIAPTMMSDTAYLWMFHTKHVQSHVFIFVRHSQIAIREALREYPMIVGHVAIANLRAQRWLKWLGAKFGEPINNYAIPFTIEASQQWQQDSVQSA